jgi:hypothetical protein
MCFMMKRRKTINVSLVYIYSAGSIVNTFITKNENIQILNANTLVPLLYLSY